MTFEEIRRYEVNAGKEISASGNHKKKEVRNLMIAV